MAFSQTKVEPIRAGMMPRLLVFLRRQGVRVTLDRLRWMLLANPARRRADPLGWILRTTRGRVVGSLLCLKRDFVFRGERCPVLISSSFFVEPPYRGQGLALFLRFAAFAGRLPLLTASAGPLSAQLMRRYGARPIARTDQEMVGMLRAGPFMRDVIRAGGAGGSTPLSARLARLAQERPGRLELLDRRGRHGGIPLGPRDGLRVRRDESYMRWRYLECPDPDLAAFLFQGSRRGCRAFVAVDAARRGGRRQIRLLSLLDYWGDLRPAELADMLAQLAAKSSWADGILLRCRTRGEERFLLRLGFHGYRLPAAEGWCLDPHGFAPSWRWALTPADRW